MDKKREAVEDDQDGTYISLKDYVSNHGFNSKCKTSLNQLVEAHAYKRHELSDPHPDWRGENYLGSLKEKQVPNPKYVDYASSSTMPRRSAHPPGRREEFAASLNRVGVSIDSDDVQEIRKVRLAGGSCVRVLYVKLIYHLTLLFCCLHMCSLRTRHIYAKNSNLDHIVV